MLIYFMLGLVKIISAPPGLEIGEITLIFLLKYKYGRSLRENQNKRKCQRKSYKMIMKTLLTHRHLHKNYSRTFDTQSTFKI